MRSVPNYTAVRTTFGLVRPRTVILRTLLDRTSEIKALCLDGPRPAKVRKIWALGLPN